MHKWAGSGGITLAGDTWGEPGGPLVVLQHGGGQTRHAWKGAGETLGNAGYHAVAFDARGHGDSDWARADAYGPDHMVEDLRAEVAKEISPIARPKEIHVVPELPKTRSGKIMRRLLRDVAEGRELGDTSTLVDPGVFEAIRASKAEA